MKRPCPWERLYHTKRWERRSKLQKKLFPLCKICLEKNIWTAADVSDHIIPHKGDLNLFHFGELQSLCHTHHSSTKALADRGIVKDYIDGIGNDGWPIDPLHPVYADGAPHSKK